MRAPTPRVNLQYRTRFIISPHSLAITPSAFSPRHQCSPACASEVSLRPEARNSKLAAVAEGKGGHVRGPHPSCLTFLTSSPCHSVLQIHLSSSYSSNIGLRLLSLSPPFPEIQHGQQVLSPSYYPNLWLWKPVLLLWRYSFTTENLLCPFVPPPDIYLTCARDYPIILST